MDRSAAVVDELVRNALRHYYSKQGVLPAYSMKRVSPVTQGHLEALAASTIQRRLRLKAALRWDFYVSCVGGSCGVA